MQRSIDTDIALRIRYWRNHAGLTQKALADKVEKSESTVTRWESLTETNAAPSTKTLKQVASACGVTWRDFVSFDLPPGAE